MASSSEQTPDQIGAQIAVLQERLRTLEEENLTMRSSNINLRKQLELISSTSQQRTSPDNPNSGIAPSNLLETFNDMANDDPSPGDHPRNHTSVPISPVD